MDEKMSNDLELFLQRVRSGDAIEFDETISLIDLHYRYVPMRFTNGVGTDQVVSEAGTNVGSLKIFSFASEQCLTEAQTLQLFGKYYRDDVLGHPEGNDHQNIRTFIRHGWSGIHFDGHALVAKD